MAETVGQHGLASFTSPSNGDPLDATVVKANDNSIRNAYVSHDSDSGIHVQSSLLASRPAAGVAGRKWVTTDTGSVRMWFDTGSAWEAVSVDSASASTASTIVARDVNGASSFKKVNLDGSTSGVVGVQAAAIAGTWTATLPDSAGTAGQLLSTNGSGVLSWTTSTGASIGISESTTSAAFYPVFFNATSGTASSLNTDGSLSWNPGTNTLTTTTVVVSGDMTVDTTTLKVDSANNRVGIGTASPTALLDVVGAASVRSVEFDGTTSGTVTVQPAATAGTWSLTLPTTAGSANQVLTTNGSGVTSWAALAQPIDVQTFNSSGTWTKPSVGSMALVEVWGAGGGGGNSATVANISGGGGGSYMFCIFALSDLSATVSVTIGAGGTGTAVGTSSAGGNGGTSFFLQTGKEIGGYGGSGGAITNATTVALGGRTGIPAGSSLDLASAVAITSSNVLDTGLTDRVFNGGIGQTSSQPPNTNNGVALVNSVYGGGGGYGGSTTGGFGRSTFGGQGGSGTSAAGTAPAGGGGRGNGVGIAAGGAGAAGRVRVTTW